MREVVIDGKFYSVDTAEFIAICTSNYAPHDPRHYEESLYRKRSGEYFLYGQGGYLSEYASHIGGKRADGSLIIPLSPVEAQHWCKTNCSPCVYISIWGGIAR